MIKELVFKPSMGFNVVTGETGAGKSIIFDALGLLLGKRSEGIALFDSSEKCVIEGEFILNERSFGLFFETHNLDFEQETIIRREIAKNGRSRSFINDTPATLQVIKELGKNLVDIHGQNQTIEIFKPQQLLQLLDAFALNEDLVMTYNVEFKHFQDSQKELIKLRGQKKEAQEQQNYFEYLLLELRQFNPKIEDIEIEDKLFKLSNAEEIKNLALDLIHMANHEERGIKSQLDNFERGFKKLDEFFPNLKLSDRLKGIEIEFKELLEDLERSSIETDVSQSDLKELEDRYKSFQDLLSKHNARTSEHLIEKYQELESRVGDTKSLDTNILELEKKLAEKMITLHSQAELIAKKRREVVPELEKNIVRDLIQLEMPHARIQFDLMNKEALGANGKNDLKVLFSANKNRALQELQKVASGGEMSRLALVLKTQQTKGESTLIFDEIDTGVSGKVAKNVGSLLAKLGQHQQVISITHSPQVASSSSTHFFVSKEVTDNETTTHIEVLDTQSQTQVIAEMLSGTDITDAALENAKMLIKSSS